MAGLAHLMSGSAFAASGFKREYVVTVALAISPNHIVIPAQYCTLPVGTSAVPQLVAPFLVKSIGMSVRQILPGDDDAKLRYAVMRSMRITLDTVHGTMSLDGSSLLLHDSYFYWWRAVPGLIVHGAQAVVVDFIDVQVELTEPQPSAMKPHVKIDLLLGGKTLDLAGAVALYGGA